MTIHGQPAIIRAAALPDIAALTKLYVSYRLFYGEPAASEASEEFLRDRIQRGAGAYFLAFSSSAEKDAEAMAFMHLMPSTNTLAMRPIWLLEDLYVDPSARGQGIAISLLRHAEEFASSTGAERITLSTAHDNAAAQSIYRKLGYVREEHFWYFHRVL
ncbi:ribosomal protein S18 acetylase RimI-like enzyme [Silvibacterium bohemicum]|uniref:Ribosomal protein S18 acetylase RimI-like enzyme n=1 Tax=Silvibacterium bohemicum TaxID=1577686 RepID=A0A841K3G7_9BACT|nr:GNAT family N-acetyltransferase [Silvibacterium bohemicum]MBB6144804.1 ribosomal protein S18 acetylase RimI-like enzyme [Silvibacterium bohemicum]